jgi:UDP-2,3-diacylglucosamine hydrolase
MTIKNILLEIKPFRPRRRKRSGRYGLQTHEKVFTIRFLNGFLVGSSDIGVRLAQYLSVKNKLISGDEDITFLEKEWLRYVLIKKKGKTLQLFIFGHRHLPMKVSVGENLNTSI